MASQGYHASCLCRENFLVLDVFFEALTSEAMEQRAAYGLSALLGEPGPDCTGMEQPSLLPLTLLSRFPGDLGGQSAVDGLEEALPKRAPQAELGIRSMVFSSSEFVSSAFCWGCGESQSSEGGRQ